MEQNDQSLTEINSYHVINIKKRKFQAEEQSCLSIPKHKCWDRTFPSDEPIYKLDRNDEVLPNKGKTERLEMDDGSEAESVKDSNSFVGDHDSKISTYSEDKMEPEYGKPSTSSVNYGTDSFKNTNYFSESLTMANANSSRDETTCGSEIKTLHNFEDNLLESENHVDYTNSRYGDDSMEQFTDNELDDILHSNGSNPNLYTLSLESLSVIRVGKKQQSFLRVEVAIAPTQKEAQSGGRKPTIDQEFEQYFSSLMLHVISCNGSNVTRKVQVYNESEECVV